MKLELFMFDTCPFCRRVLLYLEESGRTDVELHDIHKSQADRERLIAVGGKEQVPCLFIDVRHPKPIRPTSIRVL
jgi:glutaredoxin